MFVDKSEIIEQKRKKTNFSLCCFFIYVIEDFALLNRFYVFVIFPSLHNLIFFIFYYCLFFLTAGCFLFLSNTFFDNIFFFLMLDFLCFCWYDKTVFFIIYLFPRFFFIAFLSYSCISNRVSLFIFVLCVSLCSNLFEIIQQFNYQLNYNLKLLICLLCSVDIWLPLATPCHCINDRFYWSHSVSILNT